jgi:hypothetical protein
MLTETSTGSDNRPGAAISGSIEPVVWPVATLPSVSVARRL